MKIESITITEQEEEGGSTALVVYPTGYVKVAGSKSGRGYEPAYADGWYRVPDEASLRALFERAKANLEKRPEGVPTATVLEALEGNQWPAKIGTWKVVTIKVGAKEIVFDHYDGHDETERLLEGLPTPSLGLGGLEPASGPPPADAPLLVDPEPPGASG